MKGENTFLPYRGSVADVTPQEQWGNIPVIGKLQILTLIGMLESWTDRTTAVSARIFRIQSPYEVFKQISASPKWHVIPFFIFLH